VITLDTLFKGMYQARVPMYSQIKSLAMQWRWTSWKARKLLKLGIVIDSSRLFHYSY